MNLQPITASRSENNGTFTFCTEKKVSPFMELGLCASARRWADCQPVVRSNTGFADLEGAPFKAYYCPVCAARLKIILAAA